MQHYLDFLNDMTDLEFRIFMLQRMGKTQEQIVNCCNISRSPDNKIHIMLVNKVCQELKKEASLLQIKDEVLEAVFYSHSFNDDLL